MIYTGHGYASGGNYVDDVAVSLAHAHGLAVLTVACLRLLHVGAIDMQASLHVHGLAALAVARLHSLAYTNIEEQLRKVRDNL